jgi:hypothetical protein
MRRLGPALFITLLACAGALADAPPELDTVLHISFDGNREAMARDAEVTVRGGEQVPFAEGRVGKAADFRETGCIEYHDLPMFDMQSGTIEFWVNSTHDMLHMEDRYLLQFLRNDDNGGIRIRFYHVISSLQVRFSGTGANTIVYTGGWAQDQWAHFAITWNTDDLDMAGLKLYRNGAEVTAFPREYRPIEPPDFLRVGCESPDEPTPAGALIDELVVYNRSLSRQQVRVLYEHGHRPMQDKLDALRHQITAEEATKAYRAHRLFNETDFGFIYGETHPLDDWPDERFEALGLLVPQRISEGELATTDLSRYDVLLVGHGDGLRLDEQAAGALRRYVRAGGGYLGIGGGAVTAARHGLIEAEIYEFPVRGAVRSIAAQHPVTEGVYDDTRPTARILIAHNEGPLLLIKEDADEVPVLTFDVAGKPPLPTFVSAIARQYGKGRVLVFSSQQEVRNHTHRLLRNGVMWVAEIIGTEQPADVQQ